MCQCVRERSFPFRSKDLHDSPLSQVRGHRRERGRPGRHRRGRCTRHRLDKHAVHAPRPAVQQHHDQRLRHADPRTPQSADQRRRAACLGSRPVRRPEPELLAGLALQAGHHLPQGPDHIPLGLVPRHGWPRERWHPQADRHLLRRLLQPRPVRAGKQLRRQAGYGRGLRRVARLQHRQSVGHERPDQGLQRDGDQPGQPAAGQVRLDLHRGVPEQLPADQHHLRGRPQRRPLHRLVGQAPVVPDPRGPGLPEPLRDTDDQRPLHAGDQQHRIADQQAHRAVRPRQGHRDQRWRRLHPER